EGGWNGLGGNPRACDGGAGGSAGARLLQCAYSVAVAEKALRARRFGRADFGNGRAADGAVGASARSDTEIGAHDRRSGQVGCGVSQASRRSGAVQELG